MLIATTGCPPIIILCQINFGEKTKKNNIKYIELT